MNKYRVTLIVDRHYGLRLKELPIGEPVWIIDTPDNHAIIEELWKDPERKDYMTGITSFIDQDGESPEEIVLEMLDTIYDHHGPYSHDPPMDAVRIIGAKQTTEIIEFYRDEGFLNVTGVDYDFEIRTIDCEQGSSRDSQG